MNKEDALQQERTKEHLAEKAEETAIIPQEIHPENHLGTHREIHPENHLGTYREIHPENHLGTYREIHPENHLGTHREIHPDKKETKVS